MFKKLRDKIESDLKPLPQRLSSSVQQIAQVISPSPSVNSLSDSKLSEPTAIPDASNVSADFFSICDEQEIEELRQLHTVNLTADSPSILPSRSRRDSLSSIASDVSSLFPIHESPLNHSSLQYDFESEIDESTTTQLDKISKEQLYQGYKKSLHRYNKYKGRFMEVSRAHKDLQYENMKMKNVLQDSQDKALRRIAELREQCQLEQKAKAHLEESLRNDLEERGHYITTLNTKIELLKKGPLNSESNMISLDLTTNSNNLDDLITKNIELTNEVSRLKQLIEESSLHPNGPTKESTGQLKEKITQLKSGIVKMKSENENISNLLSKSPNASDAGDDNASLIDFLSDSDEKERKIEKLSGILLKCKEKINNLKSEVNEKSAIISELNDKVQKLNNEVSSAKEIGDKLNEDITKMKLGEEENAITLAENKKAIHEELEAKERHIKELTSDLELSRSTESKMKEMAESKMAHYEKVIIGYKDKVTEAVQSKNQLLNQLKKEVEKKEESKTLVKEKELLNTTFKSFLQTHQEKLGKVLSEVENKITKAEGNLARLCADKLISSRNYEIELKQKIASLEEQSLAVTHDENLEERLKNLEILLIQKDVIIEEKSAEINKLNAELNEKIDRIFALGTQIEENTDKHKLIEDSLDTKFKNITKLKADGDKEYVELGEKAKKQETELRDLHNKNSNFQKENEVLLNKNQNNLEVIAHLTEKSKTSSIESSKLQAEVYKLGNLLSDSKTIIEAKEKELCDLKINLEKADSRENEMSEVCDKLNLLEAELILVKKDKSEIMEEKCRILEEHSEKVKELEYKIQNLSEKDLSSQALNDENINRIKEKNLEIEKIHNLLETKEKETNEKLLLTSNDLLMKLQEESSKVTLLEDKLNKSNEETNAINNKHKKAIDKLVSDYEKRNKNILDERDMFREESNIEIQKLMEKLNHLVEEKKENSNAIENLNKICDEKESKVLELENIVEKLQNAAINKNDEIKSLTGKLDLKVDEEGRRIELENKIKELQDIIDVKTKENDSCQEKHSIEIQELKKQLNHYVDESKKTISDLEKLNNVNDEKSSRVLKLETEVELLQNQIKTKEEEIDELKEKLVIKNDLTTEAEIKQNKLETKIKELEELLEIKTKEIDTIHNEYVFKESASKKTCCDLENQIKFLTEDYTIKSSQLANELNLAKNKLIELKNTIDNDSLKIKDECDAKIHILKNEIKFLNEKFENEVGNIENSHISEALELGERLKHSEIMSAELLKKLEMVSAEKDEIIQVSEDKSMKLLELEACLSSLKSDLDKNFNETSKISSQQFEEVYEQKLRQLEKDYETKISLKDDLIQEAELFKSENAEVLENIKILRNDIKNLRNELKEKDNALELKIEELELIKNETKNKIANSKIDNDDLIAKEILKCDERLKSQKDEFEKQIQLEKEGYERLIEDEKRKALHSIENEKNVHENLLKEMEAQKSREKEAWFHQKKSVDDLQSSPSCLQDFETIDLERTSKVAVAAVGSNTESMDALRKEIMKQAEDIKEIKKQHKREVLELGKLAALRARSFSEREGEDVEHEYLRNILYEYMMGREQMVLAKVLAAIVKFDHQQTHNILERQSTAGALRIL